MRFAQPAALAERCVVEIVRLDADGRGDVVADEFEPGALFGREHNILGDVSFDPLVEALIDRLGKRLEHLLAFQGEADEGDEVGEAAGLGAAFDLFRRDGGEGVPEAVFGPGGVLFAEFFLQFLEHRLGEAVVVRPAVENLERGDLGFVLFDVVAERSDDLLGVLRRLLRRRRRRARGRGMITSIICSLACWILIRSWRSAGLLASGATASCIEFGLRDLQIFLRRLEVLAFAFFGFGFDIVGIGRARATVLGDLRRASGLWRSLGLRLLALVIEALLQADEAAGEAFERVRFAVAERDGIEQLVEGDGALLLQRAGVGHVPLADADGIDDDEVVLALDAGIDLLHLGLGDHAHAAAFHLLEEAARLHRAHEEDDLQRLDVRAGGDHVHGDGDARVVAVAKGLRIWSGERFETFFQTTSSISFPSAPIFFSTSRTKPVR